MLRSLRDLENYTVTATDGDIGTAVNFLLDDEHWAVRYLVLSTSGLFDGRYVLVSPISFGEIDWALRSLHLALTKAKINNSPNVNTENPVSRLHEREYHRHYGYAPYWGHSGLWGKGAFPGLLAAETWRETPVESPAKLSDIHLRSASDVREYRVQGIDEQVGHIEDFIVDDQTWEIRYLVINTSKWWLGKKVLVAPRWANRISGTKKKLYVQLSREVIKNSPEWDPAAGVNREYETRLYDYYGRPQYWVDIGQLLAPPPSPRHGTGQSDG